MRSYRVGMNTFKTTLSVECNRKQAEIAFMKLKHLTVKFVTIKKNNIVEFIIIHAEDLKQQVKNIKTIKDLFLLERKCR